MANPGRSGARLHSMSYLRAISTLGCSERTLTQVAELARLHALDGLELRGLGGTLDLPAWFAQCYGTPTALAVEASRLGAPILALGTSFKLVEGSEADRAALLAFAPWAEALKVRWLRVFDGGSSKEPGVNRAALENLNWWRSQRRMNGWQCDLMIETHDSLLTTPAIKQFIDAAEGAVILWDSHHTWKHGGEAPAETWRAIRPHVVHVHVKDSISRPSGRHPYTYVLPGDGEFPAASLFAALNADGYDGAVSLEWERAWHPYLPPIEEALASAGRYNWW